MKKILSLICFCLVAAGCSLAATFTTNPPVVIPIANTVNGVRFSIYYVNGSYFLLANPSNGTVSIFSTNGTAKVTFGSNGVITATSFIGDGSQLTGVVASGGVASLNGASTNQVATNFTANGAALLQVSGTVIQGKQPATATGINNGTEGPPVIIQGAHGGDAQAGNPNSGGPLYLYGGDYGNDTNDNSGAYGPVIIGVSDPTLAQLVVDPTDNQVGIYNADVLIQGGILDCDNELATSRVSLDAGEGDIHPDNGYFGNGALIYQSDGSASNATWTVNGGTNTSLQLSSTTSFITFSQTNTAPVVTNAFRWVGVSLAGDTNVYRMPIYK